MTLGRTLSLQTLVDKKATISQQRFFREKFGDSIGITECLCVEIVDDFDFEWAVRNLLDAESLKCYTAAITPARKVYCSPVTVVGEQTYCEAITETLRVFAVARAVAFADAYNHSPFDILTHFGVCE